MHLLLFVKLYIIAACYMKFRRRIFVRPSTRAYYRTLTTTIEFVQLHYWRTGGCCCCCPHNLYILNTRQWCIAMPAWLVGRKRTDGRRLRDEGLVSDECCKTVTYIIIIYPPPGIPDGGGVGGPSNELYDASTKAPLIHIKVPTRRCCCGDGWSAYNKIKLHI